MAAELEFDDSRFPLVVLRCPTALDVRATDALRTGLERLFARGQKFALVCDMRPVARIPDAVIRRRLADVMNLPHVREGQARFQVGSANLIDSAPLRAALTALLWLWTPPTPMTICATMDDAIAWSIERLREANVELPASLSTPTPKRASR